MKVGVYIELNPEAQRGNILLDAFRDHPQVTHFYKLLPSKLRVIALQGETRFYFDELEVKKENLDLMIIRGGLKDIPLNIQLVKHCLREGISVFDNNLHKVGYLINKKADNMNFATAGLPIPATYFFNDISQIEKEILHFPLVMKVISSSRGKKVYKVSSVDEVNSVLYQSRNKIHEFLFQEFIDYEKDLRIIVMGDEVLGAMQRIPGEGEFRANYSLGGAVELFDTPEEMRSLAVKAAKACDLKISGVDILVDKKGDYFILEANRNPGLSGISKALGYNVAEKVVEYILKDAGNKS